MTDEKKCKYCSMMIPVDAKICPCCRETLDGSLAGKITLVFVVVAFFISVGCFRIYYGGDIGFKIVVKNSYSFTDTIVNLDDILGQPRLVVASQHPAVKRQLEKMGIIETDEQITARIERDIKAKMGVALEPSRQNAAQAAIAELKARANNIYASNILNSVSPNSCDAIALAVKANAATLGDFTATVSSCSGNTFVITITEVRGEKLVNPQSGTWTFPTN